MIPSITNGEFVGTEVQFTTNSGLKSVDFGVRVSNTNIRSFSKLNEDLVVSAWGKAPSNVLGHDPNTGNTWAQEWSWATDSTRDVVQTFTASNNLVYMAIDNSGHTNTRIYTIDENGNDTLLYNFGTINGSNTYNIGAFAENSSGVHFVHRNTITRDLTIRNLSTGGTDVINPSNKSGQPSLLKLGDDLWLFFRNSGATPDEILSYKQTDKVLNDWTFQGTYQANPEIQNFNIISTNDKFYNYLYDNANPISFPNKLLESTNLYQWTEVVDFGSRLPTNSRLIQNDSLHIDTTDYVVIREGQPSSNDDSTAYLYYLSSDKLVPLGDEYGILEQANADNNEIFGARQGLNDIKSATAYPICKFEGNEIEYSVSKFTDTEFDVDLGLTPSVGEYTLYWMDGSSTSISIGTPIISEVTDTSDNTITEATQGQQVKVKGTDFLAPRTLYFDGVSMTLISESDTEIEFQIPIDATIGLNDIYIDSNGNLSNTVQLTINSAIVPHQDYTLSANGQDFPIQYIEEGYESTIELPWSQIEKENLQVSTFDDGSIYDVYKCKFSAVMEKADYDNLMLVYRDNKDLNFTLVAQNGGAGFSPFSPAYGDQGTFTFKINELKQSGTLDDERYQWFRVSFDVVNAGVLPSYSPSLGNNEGNLQIGTIGGLRYPIGGYNPNVDFDTSAIGLATSSSYAQSWENDDQRTRMRLRLLFDKMSLLIKHLLSERTNELAILVPSGHYPFGAEGGDNQSFQTRMLTKTLRIKQIKNKRYEINLEFQRVIDE